MSKALDTDTRTPLEAALDIAVTALNAIQMTSRVGMPWTAFHSLVMSTSRKALADIATLRQAQDGKAGGGR